MSKFQLQPGRGNLTSVRDKKTEKSPDFKGELRLEDGTTIRLAAWVRKFDWGQAISLSIDNYKSGTYPREAQRRDAGDVPF